MPRILWWFGCCFSWLSLGVKAGEGECNATTAVIRLGLEWFVNPDHLPLIVGQSHGIFARLGLDVQLVEPDDHWQAEEEIINGRLDVAVTEPLHLAMDAAQGKPVLGFARFLYTDGGVMYRADKISRPADMCDATISYPGSPGPGGPAIVSTMIQADGRNDCPLDSFGRYNGGFYHTDALESGQADVATLVFWNFEIPEARERGLPVGFFSLKEWGVPDFCQLVLMTTPEIMAKRQADWRKLVLGMRQAIGVIHQQPELAKQYYRDYVGAAKTERDARILEATLSATLPAFPNDNMMAEDYYRRLMAWLVETKQVDQEAAGKVPVSQYWTNEVAW